MTPKQDSFVRKLLVASILAALIFSAGAASVAHAGDDIVATTMVSGEEAVYKKSGIYRVACLSGRFDQHGYPIGTGTKTFRVPDGKVMLVRCDRGEVTVQEF